MVTEERLTRVPAPKEHGMFGGPWEQAPQGGLSLWWEARLEGPE